MMRLGNVHKKKRYLLNKIKVNFLSLFPMRKRAVQDFNGNIESCLLIHDNNKLGDLIVLSSLYREFALRNVKLSILTTESGKALLRDNKNIHSFFIKKSNNLSDILKLRSQLQKEFFDIVLDPFETMPSFGHSLLLSSLNTTHLLGFDKWYKRYYSFYHAHDENLKTHMCTRAEEIFKYYYSVASEEYNISYDLPISAEVEGDVKRYLGNAKVIIINPLGAKKICRLSAEQINVVYTNIRTIMPDYRVVFTGLPKDLQSIDIDKIETLPYSDFVHTVALTKLSQYVISVDTALVHIASAYNVPTLALYPYARHPSYPSHLIWAPNNCKAVQIVSPTCTVKDISPDILVNALKALFTQYQK